MLRASLQGPPMVASSILMPASMSAGCSACSARLDAAAAAFCLYSALRARAASSFSRLARSILSAHSFSTDSKRPHMRAALSSYDSDSPPTSSRYALAAGSSTGALSITRRPYQTGEPDAAIASTALAPGVVAKLR